ncbi:MAG: hypothetical protein IJ510_02650 [Selenomonadales bacterium]|nr:hypothetical protein [Selenomonadales bacterium]
MNTGGVTELQVMAWGFLVWLMLAPRPQNEQYPMMLASYVVTLALCLIGTENLWRVMPIAFYFMIGGAFAFMYVFFSRMVVVRVKRR